MSRKRLARLLIRAKKNKYNAVKVVVNGKTCDSKIEGEDYAKLLLIEKEGKISNLKFHPRYPIVINGEKVCTVVLDFEYLDNETLLTHYIDRKGVYTSESKLRHKLLKTICNIEVEIWVK